MEQRSCSSRALHLPVSNRNLLGQLLLPLHKCSGRKAVGLAEERRGGTFLMWRERDEPSELWTAAPDESNGFVVCASCDIMTPSRLFVVAASRRDCHHHALLVFDL